MIKKFAKCSVENDKGTKKAVKNNSFSCSVLTLY